VVLVDDIERQLDLSVQRALAPALRRALPRVQWIVTTASPLITGACDASEVLALRRMEATERVELFEGDLARLH
jgi:predicted ATP-binding protein involved in virulence